MDASALPSASTSRLPIFVPKLDDENYLSWLTCITNALVAHQVYQYADGSAVRPDDSPSRTVTFTPAELQATFAAETERLTAALADGSLTPAAFQLALQTAALESTRNSQIVPLTLEQQQQVAAEVKRYDIGRAVACSIIAGALPPKYLHFCMGTQDPTALLKKIHDHFAPLNDAQRTNRREAFERFRMKEKETIDLYLQRFEAELTTIRLYGYDYEDQELARIFRKGLNPTIFAEIIQHLSTREVPITNYLKIHEIITTRDEALKASLTNFGMEPARTKGNSPSGFSAITGKKYCSIHHCTTHDISECRKAQATSSSNATGETKAAAKYCKFCKRKVTSHKESNCYKNPANKSREKTVAKIAIIADSTVYELTPSPSATPTTVTTVTQDSALASTSQNSHTFCVDTGASKHFCNDASVFDSIQDDRIENITIADGTHVPSHGHGPALQLSDVIYVPTFPTSLLSVRRSCAEHDAKVEITKDRVNVIIDDEIKLSGYPASNGTYNVDINENWLENSLGTAFLADAKVPDRAKLIHSRLAHQGHKIIEALISTKVKGTTDLIGKANLHDLKKFCNCCALGKSTRKSHPPIKDTERNSTKGSKIYNDISGPYPRSFHGERYLDVYVDDHTEFIWGYCCAHKSDKFDNFVNLHKTYLAHLPNHQTTLHSDPAGENISNALKDLSGVILQYTSTDTPQQNGKSERANRTIKEGCITLLIASGLPKSYWPRAISYFIFTRNRTRIVKDKKTAYHLWTGKEFDVSYLRTFGCIAYVHRVHEAKLPALAPKSWVGIFLGYDSLNKGYIVEDPVTRKIYSTIHVTFNENLTWKEYKQLERNGESLPDPKDFIEDEFSDSEILITDQMLNRVDLNRTYHIPAPAAIPIAPAPAPIPVEEPIVEVVEDHPDEASLLTEDHNGDEEEFTEEDLQSIASTGRPTRNRSLPSYLKDYITNLSLMAWASEAVALVSKITSKTPVPKNYKEATNSPQKAKWKIAMEKELAAIKDNNTYIYVPKSEAYGKNVIGHTWTFRIKEKPGEDPEYKARLCAQGFSQRKGIDYDRTFAPVARQVSIKVLLAIATFLKWKINQMDFANAYLNGDIDAEVFMTPPVDDKDVPADHVCKLMKSLYGLKQAGKIWNNTVVSHLIDVLGFTRLVNDESIFIKKEGSTDIIIALYVDDILIMSSSDEKIKQVKAKLTERFKMKDLGEPTLFLGIQFEKLPDGSLKLHQKQYIEKMLVSFDMASEKPVSTPGDPDVHLSQEMAPKNEDEKKLMAKLPYRSAVGSLLYAALHTRPDISFSVNQLSMFVENPGPAHWEAARRVFAYLRGTTDLGIVLGGPDSLPNPPSLQLTAYSDAAFANNIDTRRSTNGFIEFMCNSPISWKSKAQPIVALSTTEAEYVALAECAKETLWTDALIKELAVLPVSEVTILEDNMGAIRLAENPTLHQRSKHIDVKYHFIREHIGKGHFNVHYIETAHQLADLLTKNQSPPTFMAQRSQIMN